DEHDGVHIVDFGLAPALTGSTGAPTREVTMTGPLPGTIEYLSPEQVRGEPLDARSDIYALGVMLWELIAGKPPFVGDAVRVAEAHLNAPLPELPRRRPVGPSRSPSNSLSNWAPADLEPLLHLALAKDPGERLASVGEFLQLLTAIPAVDESTHRAKPRPAIPPAPVGKSTVIVRGPASTVAPPPPARARPSAPPPAVAQQAITRPPEPAVARPVDDNSAAAAVPQPSPQIMARPESPRPAAAPRKRGLG